MPFATDRDLLILEPGLFRDVAWTAQRLISATGSISGTTLTCSTVDFAAQGVDTGHIAIVDGVPVEVLARLSATQLTVSRPRSSLDDSAVPPTAATSKPVTLHTFMPQVQIVHDQILRMAGIEPADAALVPGALTEAAITNPRSLRLVEALGALHLIFAAAAAASPPNSDSAARAAAYRTRFDRARRVAAARIDTNADGIPDATRYLNSVHLERA